MKTVSTGDLRGRRALSPLSGEGGATVVAGPAAGEGATGLSSFRPRFNKNNFSPVWSRRFDVWATVCRHLGTAVQQSVDAPDQPFLGCRRPGCGAAGLRARVALSSTGPAVPRGARAPSPPSPAAPARPPSLPRPPLGPRPGREFPYG